MVVATPQIAPQQEVERLKLLIPNELHGAIEICSASPVDRQSIATHRIKHHRCQIQLNFLRWQTLDLDLRNLLFWHEIARIKTGSIGSDRSIYMSIGVGLSIASIDLFTHNIGLLTTSLLVAGLAAFRLYQKYLGEENLRKFTTADREAIELAVKFGYERSTARELLKLAIQNTSRQTQTSFTRDRDAVRLQVLALT